jgi:hypothetical protein
MGAADEGRGSDLLAVRALARALDRGSHHTLFRVEKWDDDQIAWTRRRLDLPVPAPEPAAHEFALVHVTPFEVYEKENCNEVLDAGWVLMMNGIAGSAVTKYSSSAAQIGGGTSSAALAYTQTDLQAATGASSRQWELVSGSPTVGTSHAAGLAFAASFPTTDGNFSWQEFGVDQGAAGGTGTAVVTMFNRGLATPGTKTSSQTWTVTMTTTWT